jgi:hypothetical protein
MKDTKNPANGTEEIHAEIALAESPRRGLSERVLCLCHSGPKASNPRGLGTESPCHGFSVSVCHTSWFRKVLGTRISLAGFLVSLIGRIEASPKAAAGRRHSHGTGFGSAHNPRLAAGPPFQDPPRMVS